MPDLDDFIAEVAALTAAVDTLVENTAFKRAELDGKVDEAQASLDAMEALIAGLMPEPFCAYSYSGTPSTIVLTSPTGGRTPVLGMKVRFKATDANGGATTINIDGSGAVACRNVRGTALPAGYVRTDRFTEAVFDGTYWVLDRAVEAGSNANGYYVRHADGRLWMRHKLTTSTGGAVNWTFPMTFNTDSTATIMGSTGATSARAAPNIADNTYAAINAYDSAGARVAASVHLEANGFWY